MAFPSESISDRPCFPSRHPQSHSCAREALWPPSHLQIPSKHQTRGPPATACSIKKECEPSTPGCIWMNIVWVTGQAEINSSVQFKHRETLNEHDQLTDPKQVLCGLNGQRCRLIPAGLGRFSLGSSWPGQLPDNADKNVKYFSFNNKGAVNSSVLVILKSVACEASFVQLRFWDWTFKNPQTAESQQIICRCIAKEKTVYLTVAFKIHI